MGARRGQRGVTSESFYRECSCKNGADTTCRPSTSSRHRAVLLMFQSLGGFGSFPQALCRQGYVGLWGNSSFSTGIIKKTFCWASSIQLINRNHPPDLVNLRKILYGSVWESAGWMPKSCQVTLLLSCQISRCCFEVFCYYVWLFAYSYQICTGNFAESFGARYKCGLLGVVSNQWTFWANPECIIPFFSGLLCCLFSPCLYVYKQLIMYVYSLYAHY